VHTFPEHRSLALDVFCCRPVSGDLARLLVKAVGAQRVNQTAIERSLSEPPAPSPTRPRGNGDGRG
jgi:S-adenosylmethionine/arginine decarboxylase-like enzyme